MPLTFALAGDLPSLLEMAGSASVALSESIRRSSQGHVDALDVSVLSGPDAVALAEPAWRSIEAVGGAATPFQSHVVAAALSQAHHRRAETPRVIIVREGDKPVVVLPTVVTRWNGVSTVRFLGDPLIQYGDAIAAPGVSIDHLEAAWNTATDPAIAAFAFMRKVRSDARIAPLLQSRTVTVATHEAPHADTGRPYVAVNARELRRYRRRLEERGEVAFNILKGCEAQGAALEAVAIKRTWLAERGLASGVIGDLEWETAMTKLAAEANSPLRVARLSVGGQTAAIEIGLLHADRWCAFLGAISPDFARFGPGHLQMAETIAHCHARGIATYDLLAPGDSYKNRIAHDHTLVRDHATALSILGWPSLCAARSIPAIKQLAARMPAGLMRAILGRRGG